MSISSPRENNRVPAIVGTSSVDGTPVLPYVDPTTHRLLVDIPGGGTGDVSGPASAVDGNIVSFDTTTGKLIKDGGKTIAEIEAEIPATPAGGFAGLTALGDKVDKVSGKGLSTNDYDDTAESKLAGIESSADVTDAGNVGSSINGVTAKEAMVDADKLAIIDTENSNALKTLSWAFVKSILKTYFDGLYALTGHNHSGVYEPAIGFTPENSANKKTSLTDNSDTYYPTQKAVKTAVDGKAPIASPTFTGTVTTPAIAITASDANGNLAIITNTDATNYSRIKYAGTVNSFSSGVGNGSATIADLVNKFYIYDFTNTKIAMTITPNTLATKLYGSLETVGSIELGHASDTTIARVSAGVISVEGVTIPTISSTSTLTNKNIVERVVTTTDDATAVIDTDACDQYQLTAIANATEFSVSGTPTNGQKLLIRYVDAGTTKNLTYAADTFRVIGVTLPTATVANKTGYIGCVYNSAASRWDVLAVGLQA
jgi:hypothetical protein